MTSELKVDTISEKTSAAGVTIDSVLIKDGNVDGVDISAITQGIKEYDNWELTADITTNADITSNLARPSRTLVTKMGTGMTQSSGVFTFPSTGLWLVKVFLYALSNSGDTVLIHTIATDDDFSSSTNVSIAKFGNNASTSETGGRGYSEVMLDIEDTSTDKVKFASVSIASGSSISGTLGSLPETYFVFERLGDT
tara:strand:- start:236 stop:823 length:588 start_codon:yes stop_codon:yes gene_type:complete